MSTTIVAQSTPAIASAIAIIRLSGKNALPLCRKFFSGFKGEVKPRYAYFGKFTAGGITDDCICIYFAAPHSYTGEDMAEIYSHGSVAVTRAIIEQLILAGATMAQRGEFTRRAFENGKMDLTESEDMAEIYSHGSVAVTRAIIEQLILAGATMAQRGEFTRRAFENGKMDLTESEAVIDLINAESEAEARSAYEQLSGALSEKIDALQKKTIELIAGTEAAIDYPEEDVEEMTLVSLRDKTSSLYESLCALKDTYNAGKIMRSGVKVAIVGKPNAGKSMLMNRLLGYERSIVSSSAGSKKIR